jgi:hypothetical protein
VAVSTVGRTRPIDPVFVLRALLSILGLFMIWLVVTGVLNDPAHLGYDARAYWGYPRDAVYAGPGESAGYGIYRYSPVFVPLMTLFTLVPWTLFVVGWVALGAAVYLWLAGPWWLALLAFPPFVIEMRMGNVHLLLALAIVLGFRWPATWSFVLLTKVTPGIGLLWFAVRREWRSLAIALGATAVLVTLSLVLTPGLWPEWIRSLTQTSEPDVPLAVALPLWPRFIAAVILVIWGARTDRRWTVVVGATLALPVLWFHGLAMIAGVVAVQRGLPERASTSLDWLRLFSRRGTVAPAPGSVGAGDVRP